MTIEIVDFPIEHGDFPVRYVSHNQRVTRHVGHVRWQEKASNLLCELQRWIT